MNQTPLAKTGENIEDIEISLLAIAIYRRWGYDFRHYAPASLKRRVKRIVELEGLSSMSELQGLLLRDERGMQRFLDQVTVSVTSMFRDSEFYKSFRAIAVPLLKQCHPLRIWHAGCATGEEVYSMAILLHEVGLLEKCQIYATDINQTSLCTAKSGIYPLSKMQEYTQNYQAAGGTSTFSEYYRAGHGSAMMAAHLSKKIIWAQHSLVTDASFNEFNLIMCRNVLIYFNHDLQKRVHELLYASLARDGILVLGRQESMQLTPHESRYRTLDSREKIYQRVC